MTDKELIKSYDQDFWDLIDEGNSTRKSKRVLKRVYPSVTYNAGLGQYTVNGNNYYVKDTEIVPEKELVGDSFYQDM